MHAVDAPKRRATAIMKMLIEKDKGNRRYRGRKVTEAVMPGTVSHVFVNLDILLMYISFQIIHSRLFFCCYFSSLKIPYLWSLSMTLRSNNANETKRSQQCLMFVRSKDLPLRCKGILNVKEQEYRT